MLILFLLIFHINSELCCEQGQGFTRRTRKQHLCQFDEQVEGINLCENFSLAEMLFLLVSMALMGFKLAAKYGFQYWKKTLFIRGFSQGRATGLS